MGSGRKVKVDGIMSLATVVDHLESVVASLKDGTVTLQVGAESMTVRPPEIVDFELEIASKKDKERVSIEIQWKGSTRVASAKPITISSGGE